MAEMIDANLAFKALCGGFKRAGHNAGIADKNIEAVMLAQKIIGEFFHRAQIAQIHSANMGAVNNAVQSGLRCFGAARRYMHMRPRLDQSAGGFQANAGIAAGYQNIFAVQINTAQNLIGFRARAQPCFNRLLVL